MPQIEDITRLIKAALESKVPDWKKSYWERLAKNLQVHTKGLLFSKVDTLFPNEHPDSKAHCVNTYEPITKGSVWKAINDLSRIFSNSSFSVSASDTTAAIIAGNTFGDTDLFNYFLSRWIEETIVTDANSWVAVYPDEYVKAYGGERVRFIRSEHLKGVTSDFVAFVSLEESKVTESVEDRVVSREVFYDPEVKGLNGREAVVKTYNHQLTVKVEQPVYHVFTKDYLLRFWKEDPAQQDWDYEAFDYPAPGRMIPTFSAGGVEIHEDIAESFVAPFIPFGNLALLQHRNHRAVDLMFSYPRMSEIQTPCDNDCRQNGINSRYMVGEKECGKCKGTGFITVQSPYKVYQKKVEGGIQSDDQVRTILTADPVSFHTPDVSILNYSKDSWKEYLRMAEEAVFVYQKKVGADAESFESKMVDMEGKFSWLLTLSKVFFWTLRQTIQALENYASASPVDVSIEEPKSFAILSEGEAFAFLNQIISSDAPVWIKQQHTENFMQKFVSKSSPIVKAMRILKKVDPLLFYSNKDVQTFKSNNTIKPETWTAHIYAYPVLMQLYEDDKKLFDKDDKAVITLLKAAIAELSPDQSEDLKAGLLNVVS